jgi:hypothetical protein
MEYFAVQSKTNSNEMNTLLKKIGVAYREESSFYPLFR